MQADSEVVIQKLRRAIAAKGANCLRGLAKVFRLLDSFDGNNKVDREEFVLGLRKLGLTVTEKDSMVLFLFSFILTKWTIPNPDGQALFAALDKNGDGFLDFEEFLTAIRVKQNSFLSTSIQISLISSRVFFDRLLLCMSPIFFVSFPLNSFGVPFGFELFHFHFY